MLVEFHEHCFPAKRCFGARLYPTFEGKLKLLYYLDGFVGFYRTGLPMKGGARRQSELGSRS